MRYVIKFGYDGSNYSGFQRQKNADTIQSILEDVLTKIVGDDINIVASGRTDAGVSALEQVAHFDCNKIIDEHRTLGYVNACLPKDIRIFEIINTSDDFHARYDAKKKTYQYIFYVGHEENPIYEKFATRVGYDLNIDKMMKSCDVFLGEHDFSAFCASRTEVVNKVRFIHDISITCIEDNLYRFEITGNGFLYNMVRIIMGTLIGVGCGKLNEDDIKIILESKDRNKAGKTMPSKGLILKKVCY